MIAAALLDDLAERIEAAAGDVYNKLLPLAQRYDKHDQYSSGRFMLLDAIFGDFGLDQVFFDYDGDMVPLVEQYKDAFSEYRSYARYIPWLTRCFEQMPDKSADDRGAIYGLKKWLKDNFKNVDSVAHGKDLSKFTLPQAIEQYNAHETKKATDAEKIVYRFANGRTFRRLTKLRQIRDEGNAQHNCCGDSQHMYDRYAEENGWNPAHHIGGIYALRGPANERIATVEVDDRGTAKQRLGKNNAALTTDDLLDIEEVAKTLIPPVYRGDLSADIRSGNAPSNLVGMDLRFAKMKGGLFFGQDFRGANLEGVNLSRADLTNAAMRGCNLKNANLSGTNVTGTDFGHADLSGVLLDDALNLKKAELHDAKNVDPKVMAWWKAQQSGAQNRIPHDAPAVPPGFIGFPEDAP